MANFEKQISSESIYDGKILTVRRDKVELQNGRISTREIIGHAGAVGVVPLDDDGSVIAVSQFRYPFGREMLEIPAGKLEEGEDILDCAKRELAEETGFTASEYIYLGAFYPTPAYCEEVIHIYLARGLSEGDAHPDENEFVDAVRIPLDKLSDMIMNDEIHDAKTIIGILKTLRYLKGTK